MSQIYTPTNPVRPDEVFYKTNEEPYMSAWGYDWLYRRVEWRIAIWTFRSYVLLWGIRWYHGDGKIDATQTYRLRNEEHAYRFGYVVTTTKKEQFSVRFSWKRPDRERWDNQGGI